MKMAPVISVGVTKSFATWVMCVEDSKYGGGMVYAEATSDQFLELNKVSGNERARYIRETSWETAIQRMNGSPKLTYTSWKEKH